MAMAGNEDKEGWMQLVQCTALTPGSRRGAPLAVLARGWDGGGSHASLLLGLQKVLLCMAPDLHRGESMGEVQYCLGPQ